MPKTIVINPERLKALLERSKFSQKELAAKLGVDEGTVSRWKRGIVPRLRSNHFARLLDVLSATRQDLCDNGPLPERPDDREAPRKDQMNLMIDTVCRNALGLVAKRYGVTQQQIVEVAPLLFFIAAEQSLAERRERLKQQQALLAEADDAALPHLKHWLRYPYDEDDQELFDAEERSIENRDPFAKNVGAWTDKSEVDNPFARHLTNRLAEIQAWADLDSDAVKVRWEAGEEPRYATCVDALVTMADEIVRGDEEARNLILKGEVGLHEMPGEIRRGPPEEKAKWVREKAKANWDEIQRELGEFLEHGLHDLGDRIAQSHSDDEF